MGIDYEFSFGYGFTIPNVEDIFQLDKLEDLIILHATDENNLRYCQDAYCIEKKIFICIGGFNSSYWNDFENDSGLEITFAVSDSDLKTLEIIGEEYGIGKTNFEWIGFHYNR